MAQNTLGEMSRAWEISIFEVMKWLDRARFYSERHYPRLLKADSLPPVEPLKGETPENWVRRMAAHSDN